MNNIPGYYQDPSTGKYFKIDSINSINEIIASTIKFQDEKRLKSRKHQNYAKLLGSRSLGILKTNSFKNKTTYQFLQNVEENKPKFTLNNIANNRTIHHLGRTSSSLYMYCKSIRNRNIEHEISFLQNKNAEHGLLNLSEKPLLKVTGELKDFQILQNSNSNFLISVSKETAHDNKLTLYKFFIDDIIIKTVLYNSNRKCNKVQFLNDSTDHFSFLMANNRTLVLENVNTEDKKQVNSKKYSSPVSSIDYNAYFFPCAGFRDGYIIMKDLRTSFSKEVAEFYGGAPNIKKLKYIQDKYIVCEAVQDQHLVCLFDIRNTNKPVFEYLNMKNSFAEKIPFILDSSNSMIFLDCKLMRNSGRDNIVRVFDLHKGTIIAAYQDFQQLMYEEEWPSINQLQGFVGLSNNSVAWLPACTTI